MSSEQAGEDRVAERARVQSGEHVSARRSASPGADQGQYQRFQHSRPSSDYESDGDGASSEGRAEEDDNESHDGDGDANSHGGGEAGRRGRKKLRRACDYCTQKKVRCDGKRPCSQCQRRNLQCNFSICQRSGPRNMHPGMEYMIPAMHNVHAHAAARSGAPAGAGPMLPLASSVAGAPRPTMTPAVSALSAGGITSKSDVTFLNFFLKEFNAFVPLTTQNILKEALNPMPTSMMDNASGDEEFRRQNARVAVIQGCVGIGAVVKGQADIALYLLNVREALQRCFDFVSFETMCAYMVVAYCNDLLGNSPATRNYMEFAKAIATQLPQITVESELVFQFYRVCSEIHARTLSATPKLLQQAGVPVPCYQVLNVLTYALYDLAHLAMEEDSQSIGKDQVKTELESLLPILVRADKMSMENTSSFGALGVVLIKSTLAYILLRMGNNNECLQALEPVVGLLEQNPGLMRQIICWHFSHCIMVIYLEHGGFKEYDALRQIYNAVLAASSHSLHFQEAKAFPSVEELHTHGNSFLCSNPLCRAVYNDLSEVPTPDLQRTTPPPESEQEQEQGVSGGEQQAQGGQGRGEGAREGLMNMVAGDGFINLEPDAEGAPGARSPGGARAAVATPGRDGRGHGASPGPAAGAGSGGKGDRGWADGGGPGSTAPSGPQQAPGGGAGRARQTQPKEEVVGEAEGRGREWVAPAADKGMPRTVARSRGEGHTPGGGPGATGSGADSSGWDVGTSAMLDAGTAAAAAAGGAGAAAGQTVTSSSLGGRETAAGRGPGGMASTPSGAVMSPSS